MKKLISKRRCNSIALLLAALLLFTGILPCLSFTAEAATSSTLASQLSSCLPLVTYATPLSGASKVYAYNDASLSVKNTGYYICTYTDPIVITQISSDGRAIYCSYPSSSSSTGYRSKWFAADDILGLENVSINRYTADSSSNTYRLSSSYAVKKYGSISRSDSSLCLGSRKVGGTVYYPTVYPISATTVNRIGGITHKLALAPSNGSSAAAAPAAAVSMTDALYGLHNSVSKLTCGFDGYVSLRNLYGYRHEGIDFAYGSGKALYSLTDGVVSRVTAGSSSKLSTVAIYYAAKNVTVVYLHLAPSVAEGQTVTKGSFIGTEAARGAGGSVHTHVEVRQGYRTSAAVSSDTVLVNSNPTSFWNSLGYTIK